MNEVYKPLVIYTNVILYNRNVTELYLLGIRLGISEGTVPRAVDLALVRLGACRLTAVLLSITFLGGVLVGRAPCVLPAETELTVSGLFTLVTFSLEVELGNLLVAEVLVTVLLRLVEFCYKCNKITIGVPT